MEATTQSGQQSAVPICSLIIPTKDILNFLKPCIESVLASDHSGTVEIIIVDNGSVEVETQQYLQSLSDLLNVRVLCWNEPFNFSAINNFAASGCVRYASNACRPR